jgi:DNA-binding beta-propeller fold protein YncE
MEPPGFIAHHAVFVDIPVATALRALVVTLAHADAITGKKAMLRSTKFAALAVMAAALFGSTAQAQYLIIGDDNKLHWDDAGKPAFTEPGKDEVLIVDIKDREAPKIVATLPLDNTIVGPPTNLAVTPDEKLALIANSLNYEPNGSGGWKPVPDNRIFVIDLTASPPKQIATVEVGKQPSGMAINKTGTLVLVADRADNAVTVLAISGKDVKPVGTVALGDTVSAIAITPDGKHALVSKHAANKVAWLDIDGQNVTYNKTDVAVGSWPYNVQITADGHFGLTANQGNNGIADGGVGSVSVIDLKAEPPRLVDYVTVDSLPEGLGVSPTAPLAIAVSINGSGTAPKGAWFENPYSLLDILSTADGRVRKIGSIRADRLPEGIAFSPEGKYLYVGNFSDSNLQIFRVVGDSLRDTGKVLKLPGHPASVRGNTP